eukprot:GDKJ01022836.1.p1 GENE.GDKJ01022836.1~~GDKJ01022836.1.p1  ORF type:complete len:621 (+),score=107.47 GDKJ01022836.1:121-1863(+)
MKLPVCECYRNTIPEFDPSTAFIFRNPSQNEYLATICPESRTDAELQVDRESINDLTTPASILSSQRDHIYSSSFDNRKVHFACSMTYTPNYTMRFNQYPFSGTPSQPCFGSILHSSSAAMQSYSGKHNNIHCVKIGDLKKMQAVWDAIVDVLNDSTAVDCPYDYSSRDKKNVLYTCRSCQAVKVRVKDHSIDRIIAKTAISGHESIFEVGIKEMMKYFLPDRFECQTQSGCQEMKTFMEQKFYGIWSDLITDGCVHPCANNPNESALRLPRVDPPASYPAVGAFDVSRLDDLEYTMMDELLSNKHDRLINLKDTLQWVKRVNEALPTGNLLFSSMRRFLAEYHRSIVDPSVPISVIETSSSSHRNPIFTTFNKGVLISKTVFATLGLNAMDEQEWKKWEALTTGGMPHVLLGGLDTQQKIVNGEIIDVPMEPSLLENDHSDDVHNVHTTVFLQSRIRFLDANWAAPTKLQELFVKAPVFSGGMPYAKEPNARSLASVVLAEVQTKNGEKVVKPMSSINMAKPLDICSDCCVPLVTNAMYRSMYEELLSTKNFCWWGANCRTFTAHHRERLNHICPQFKF